MDFILFHENKKPILIKLNSIQMVRPPLKGNKYLIVTDMDHTIEVDESFQDIAEIMHGMDVEIVEAAND